MSLAENLKLHREKKNMSQNEVAEKLHITRQTVSKWETGKCYPDFDNLIRISNIYEASIDELLKDEKSELLKNQKIKHKDKSLIFLFLSIISFILPFGIIIAIFLIRKNDKFMKNYHVINNICVSSIIFRIIILCIATWNLITFSLF